MRFSELDQPSIGDILEIELGDEIVEAVITAIENGEIIAETDNRRGARLLAESYGRYYCSTDKKWKERKGPKQTRNVNEMDKSASQPGRDGRVSHKTYGSRDNYKLGEPESTGRPLTAKQMMDRAHKAMLKSMSNDEKVDKGWRNPNIDEGAGNIGSAIKALYQKIYAAGDDEIEYFYNDSPIFAQYWDEYEGDLDSIIAEVDPKELQIMHDELESYVQQANLAEAEYQGRKVALGKPMQGDVKKFKVYVKDPGTGNVKKVNFGDPNMRIKKSNPKRRKSFRARHNCANPGPRTKARYWSCRKW